MISERIKYQRKIVHNITQKQLADKLGVSRSTVNNWESAVVTPSLQHIILLSIVFKVSVHYLIFSSDTDDEIVLNALTDKQKSVLINLYECFSE